MNGKQRNFYLEHIKNQYPGWWFLAIDADEVVEDLSKIREWINKYDSISELYPCVSVKMRHFIGDLGHEDAVTPEHFCIHRLFKVVPDLFYPLGEHPVLNCMNKRSKMYECRATTIWHLAYVPNMWDIKKRYDNHMKKSEMHTPQFLKQWYYSHLFGQYPKSQINLLDIPNIIFNKFGIDKDELYFANRGVEAKHFIMATEWINHFVPDSIIEFGCGKAPYGFAIKKIMVDTILYEGIELSKFAVNNAFVPIKQGNITEYDANRSYDLVLVLDVLEHLTDDELNKAMVNIKKHTGKYILFSVPVAEDEETGEKADPNLYNDKTHIQFKSRGEWIKYWESNGIKILPTPKEWLCSNQLFIGENI
jgi:hypothetical protein